MAGVVGDDISFIVTPSAVGGFTGTVALDVTGLPTGANISYAPTGPYAMDTAVTITIDTDGATGAISTIEVVEAA